MRHGGGPCRGLEQVGLGEPRRRVQTRRGAGSRAPSLSSTDDVCGGAPGRWHGSCNRHPVTAAQARPSMIVPDEAAGVLPALWRVAGASARSCIIAPFCPPLPGRLSQPTSSRASARRADRVGRPAARNGGRPQRVGYLPSNTTATTAAPATARMLAPITPVTPHFLRTNRVAKLPAIHETPQNTR
jgi:hypothetical protein